METDLIVRNAEAITAGGRSRVDIGVENGQIVQLGGEMRPGPDGRELEAEGCVVTPGGVDPHVHLTDPVRGSPDFHWADDFESGTQAASARALEACHDGRRRGVPVYVETRPIYLHLTRQRLSGTIGRYASSMERACTAGRTTRPTTATRYAAGRSGRLRAARSFSKTVLSRRRRGGDGWSAAVRIVPSDGVPVSRPRLQHTPQQP